MNSLTEMLGVIPDLAGLSWGPSLVVRWTALLALGWATHAALAWRNPRWRVSLWRTVAVGVAAMPILAGVPPGVHWTLPAEGRPSAPALVEAVRSVPDAAVAGRLAHGPARDEQPSGPELRRGLETSGHVLMPGGTQGDFPIPLKSQSGTAHEGPPTLTRPVGLWLVVLWAAGVLLLGSRYVWQVRCLGGIIARSERVADKEVAQWGAPVAASSGPTCLRVMKSAEVCAPCLARAWRPVLLLPDHLDPGRDPIETHAIFAHELTHARNHDLAWNEVLQFVAVLLWFHPLVWRVRRAHAAACDAVCDAVAADQLGDVAAYGRVLARLARRAGGPPVGGLAMARACDVRCRIESLHRRVFRAPLPRKFAVPAAVTLGLCVTLIGVVRFTRAGQDPPTPASRAVRVADAKPTQPASEGKVTMLSASGTVVDTAGGPVAGASVILREWSYYRVQAMGSRLTEPVLRGDGLPDVLADTKADAAGRFRFENVRAPGFPSVPHVLQTDSPWDLVALAPGRGLAWVQLTPQWQRTPITLTIGEEGILRGQVVEPGGRPVGGAKVKVYGVDALDRSTAFLPGTDGGLGLLGSSLPLGATTGADGRFTVRGLPREQVVTLLVISPGHQRLLARAGTTDRPRPTVGPLPVSFGDLTLTVKRTDHVLTGRVLFEADGKPAAGARVRHYPEDVTAGADGRYRVEDLISGPLRVLAIADHSDAAPLMTTVEIPERPGPFERDLVLPRGLAVTGRVVDAVTGRGLDNVTIEFLPEPAHGARPAPLPFSWETDAEGRFRFGVPPGRGTVHLRTVPATFPPPDVDYTSDRKLSPPWWREVEGGVGQTVTITDFRLARAPSVVLRVVDLAGRPVAGARVEVRDRNRSIQDTRGWSQKELERTDALGRYELIGLPPGQATVVDITSDDPPLGATVNFAPESAGDGPKSVEVQLRPLVSLSGRALDADGHSLANPRVRLIRSISPLGPNGSWFGFFVDTRDEVTTDGSYTFERVIPGAEYMVKVEASGHAGIESRPVKAESSRPVRLDDFRLPATDREVRGIVVDPQGKPLAGATVGYERDERAVVFYPPSGGKWSQTTDLSGRFHLTGLPRGPVRLWAIYSQDTPRLELQSSRSVEVRPGQAEVRIELLQPYGPIRGIE